jgi:3-deoxy-7-phosphoheptulonate synthase
MQQTYRDDLCIIMRVYFEKPRTTIGWKGLINDPDLDGSFNVNKGLALGRQLLLDINELGIPCAVEFLDTLSPQWIADLVAWGAIGARTTESQCHRELASGMSMPVGFKNSTAGDFQIASDAIKSAKNPHAFLSVTKQGLAAIVHTNGNPDCHVILRGGKAAPNYYPEDVKKCTDLLRKDGVCPRVIVDCSHGNSRKLHTNQPIVAQSIADQLREGNNDIVGVMVESNITAGKQSFTPGVTFKGQLAYGQSITDACVDIADTDILLGNLAQGVKNRRSMNEQGKGSAKSDALPIKQ